MSGPLHTNGHTNGNGSAHARTPARIAPSSARAEVNVLVVGEAISAGEALLAALPGVRVEHVPDYFQALTRLQVRSFDAVLAPTAPIRRRPEAAIRRLREAAPQARLVLVADPTSEILSRKLVGQNLGCHDYVVTPASAGELAAALASDTPATTQARPVAAPAPVPPVATVAAPKPAASPRQAVHVPTPAEVRVATPAEVRAVSVGSTPFTLAGLAVAEVMLDALVREPQDCARAAVRQLNERLPATMRLELLEATDRDPPVPSSMTMVSRLLPRVGPSGLTSGAHASDAEASPRVLHLLLDRTLDERGAQDLLDQIAVQLARLLELQDRHSRLQRIAVTDELTGLYNVRYFKHFLDRILLRARENYFPVTLLLFDIDNFKKYNDTYGHAVGDEILRQTGRMMRRCVRDHDLVARLGGDEFAVVFWEKEGPRQPLSDKPGAPVPTKAPGRPPQSPVTVFQRFKRLIAGHDFEALGPTGKGMLTISGGLAVYPYDARSADELIEAADKALVFGAKRSGKNTLHLVGTDDHTPTPHA